LASDFFACTSWATSISVVPSGTAVSGVEHQSDEGEATDEIAEHRRDLVPDQVVADREVTAQHQSRREEEHVDDGMLETHVEEQHDRHPHRDHLARHRRRHHRRDHTGGHHPVAQHAADEQGQHARGAVLGVADGPGMTDLAELLPDGIGIGTEPVGDDDRHEHRDGERTQEVADEHQAEVAQHALERHASPFVDQRQRYQREHPGQQVESHQVEQTESDGEQHRTEQRFTRSDGDGDGERRGERENRARHVRAYQRIPGGQERFRLAGIDHLFHELGRLHVRHETPQVDGECASVNRVGMSVLCHEDESVLRPPHGNPRRV
jgi:hypothetical protein